MSNELTSESEKGSTPGLADQDQGPLEGEASMSTEQMRVHAVDPTGKWLYRVGGPCALVIGIAYLITIALYARVGAPPSGGEAWLKYLDGKTTLWWAILGFSVLTDLLYVPVAFALYLVLSGVARSAMQVASAC